MPGVQRRGATLPRRASSERLDGWHRRAHLAHLNAFEAVPTIVAGVMVAEFALAPRAAIDALALTFITCRALHVLLYIADMRVWRGHPWRLGMACVIDLFVVAATAG